MADGSEYGLEKGKFAYRDGIAVAQLIFFLAYLAAATYITVRHWHFKGSAWIIFITFSLLRIIGASFQLATISSPTYTNYVGALVCSAAGVAPLVIVNLGMVGRLNAFAARKIPNLAFTALHLTAAAGIGLISYGGASASHSDTAYGANIYSKISAGLIAGQYAAIWLMVLYLWRQRPSIPGCEMRLFYCVAACAPFVLVRISYTFLAAFSGDHRFRIFGGSDDWFLALAVIPEIIVCGICLATGLTLTPLKGDPRRTYEEMGSEDSRKGIMMGRV